MATHNSRPHRNPLQQKFFCIKTQFLQRFTFKTECFWESTEMEFAHAVLENTHLQWRFSTRNGISFADLRPRGGSGRFNPFLSLKGWFCRFSQSNLEMPELDWALVCFESWELASARCSYLDLSDPRNVKPGHTITISNLKDACI